MNRSNFSIGGFLLEKYEWIVQKMCTGHNKFHFEYYSRFPCINNKNSLQCRCIFGWARAEYFLCNMFFKTVLGLYNTWQQFILHTFHVNVVNIFTCALCIPLDLLKSAKSKLSHRQRAVVATRGDKFWQESVILSQNFNSLNFSRTFSAIFSAVGSFCEGGYTCDFHRALATRQLSKNRITIASPKSLVCVRLKHSTTWSCGLGAGRAC